VATMTEGAAVRVAFAEEARIAPGGILRLSLA